ncbi:unnamed protein product [Absidia cylindrospora]
MSSPAQAKKHSTYEATISLPPISEFSSQFRLPASPPMSIPNKRVKRTIENTIQRLTDSSASVSLPALGKSSVWDNHRPIPNEIPLDNKSQQQQQQQRQQQEHEHEQQRERTSYQPQHIPSSQHDQRHRTLSPSPPPTPPLPLPSSFGYYNNAAMDLNNESGTNPASPVTKEGMTSAQVLAEKRKRNAGASARFRERRKLRERDLQETCKLLDRRVFALESALKQLDPNHSLLVSSPPPASTSTTSNQPSSSSFSSLSPELTSTHHSPYHHHSQDYSTTHSTSPPPSSIPSSSSLDHTLNDRVGQLEYMMTLLHQEKITDTKKLAILEKENRHLRTKMVVDNKQNNFEDEDRHSIVSTSSSSSSLSALSRKKSLTPNDVMPVFVTSEEDHPMSTVAKRSNIPANRLGSHDEHPDPSSVL